jgi:hypothetical protein
VLDEDRTPSTNVTTQRRLLAYPRLILVAPTKREPIAERMRSDSCGSGSARDIPDA